jgi:hemerythrin-like domain-containing protein
MTKDAIELLITDHEKIKKLVNGLTDTTIRAEMKRPELLEEIVQEIKIHTYLEEKIFYPALKKTGDFNHERLCFEAFEEHRVVLGLILPDLKKTDPTSEKFSSRAKILKELIEHHADEGEINMFKEAKYFLPANELNALGEQMNHRKHELQSTNYR